MKKIGEFTATVYRTAEIKNLKTGPHEYSYGTLTIRDRYLNKFIEEEVVVRIYMESKKEVKALADK